VRDETDITQSFEAVEPPPPPPAAPPRERPAGPPPGPPPGPPRALLNDVWPWLALLLLVVVGGLLVWLFVLRGGNSKADTVPAVVGMQQQQAFKRLQQDGYSVKAIIEPANQPRGIVVSQAPGGGARLPKGSVVTLHISNGRPLTVTTAPTKTTTQPAATTTTATTTSTTASMLPVPDVRGQDMVSASGQIEAAGFVAETQPVESSEQPGQVIAESPAPGTQAPAGSTVVLQVAVSGQQPAKQVPDVLGQKAAAARQALLQAGFTVKTEYKKSPKSLGVVVAQRPAGGATQTAYTQVVITVGS
jgi:beta-lactam-binding protein with PASTA domain